MSTDLYTPFSSIPSQAIADIEAVITNDEGGFVQTSNKDDPDGGWTYAGVVSGNWTTYYSHVIAPAGEAYSAQQAASWFQALPEFKKKEIAFEIYFKEFYEPMAKAMGEEEAYPYELSCAINCGLSAAVEVHKAALVGLESAAREEAYETHFLREWTRYYIKLVVENAEAWRSYAEMVFRASPTKQVTPKVLRATNLEGWFNRVERYRTVA